MRSLKVVEAGKQVYFEKPFVIDFEEEAELISLVEKKGLYLSNAPDTFLSGGWQALGKFLDDHMIGRPIGVNRFIEIHGVERL